MFVTVLTETRIDRKSVYRGLPVQRRHYRFVAFPCVQYQHSTNLNVCKNCDNQETDSTKQNPSWEVNGSLSDKKIMEFQGPVPCSQSPPLNLISFPQGPVYSSLSFTNFNNILAALG
jgi:hypothetical protein